MGTRHFKTKAGYQKWLAFGHMHGVFEVPGHQKIVIAGKPHKVVHTKKKRKKSRKRTRR